MLAIERQSQIRELIHRQGAVQMSELVKTFGVTGETLRKDLLMLEQKGLLRRTHGGAVSLDGSDTLKKLSARMDDCRAQKRELSGYAASLICEGDVIAVDEGSTAVEFAEVLAGRFHTLTVITHYLGVFDRLCRLDGFRVILCAGQFLKEENAFYGQLTLDTLSRLHARKLFLFPSTVSLQSGVMDYQFEMYEVQRRLMEISDRIFILADSSKFGRTAVLKICDTAPQYTFVTDSGIPEETCQAFAKKNITLIRSD